MCVCVCESRDSLMEDDTVHNSQAGLLSSQLIWYYLTHLSADTHTYCIFQLERNLHSEPIQMWN